MGFRSACSRLFCRNHNADFVDANCTRYTRSQGQAPPRPGAPRLRGPRSHLQARRRHRAPAHRRGVAVPGHGDRPARAHGGGMAALRPDDRRHRRGGLGIREVERLRGRKRRIPQRQGRPVHRQDLGRVGAGQRRAPVVRPHRQLPRQRRGRVVLRHPEEFFHQGWAPTRSWSSSTGTWSTIARGGSRSPWAG